MTLNHSFLIQKAIKNPYSEVFLAFFEAEGREADLQPGGPDGRAGESSDSNLYAWRDREKGTADPER